MQPMMRVAYREPRPRCPPSPSRSSSTPHRERRAAATRDCPRHRTRVPRHLGHAPPRAGCRAARAPRRDACAVRYRCRGGDGAAPARARALARGHRADDRRAIQVAPMARARSYARKKPRCTPRVADRRRKRQCAGTFDR